MLLLPCVRYSRYGCTAMTLKQAEQSKKKKISRFFAIAWRLAMLESAQILAVKLHERLFSGSRRPPMPITRYLNRRINVMINRIERMRNTCETLSRQINLK